MPPNHRHANRQAHLTQNIISASIKKIHPWVCFGGFVAVGFVLPVLGVRGESFVWIWKWSVNIYEWFWDCQCGFLKWFLAFGWGENPVLVQARDLRIWSVSWDLWKILWNFLFYFFYEARVLFGGLLVAGKNPDHYLKIFWRFCCCCNSPVKRESRGFLDCRLKPDDR